MSHQSMDKNKTLLSVIIETQNNIKKDMKKVDNFMKKESKNTDRIIFKNKVILEIIMIIMFRFRMSQKKCLNYLDQILLIIASFILSHSGVLRILGKS